jgi:hypothetical protein
MDKVHEVKFNYIILYTSYYKSFLSFSYRLLVFLLLSFGLGFVILYVLKYYKQNSSLKEKVSIRYDFVTCLRWLRASSPAVLRPPFVHTNFINLFAILRARLGMLSKSAGDKLKLGLLITFPCSQPDFRKAKTVPREATRAQKSPCPAITSSRSSISPSICSKAPDRSSVEGVNFLLLAPTE